MSEALATLGVFALSGACGALLWTVRVLWQLDRRLVRVEEHLGFHQARGVP